MDRIGIAVAGASCSGKTTLANAVGSELDAATLRIDDYYRPLGHLTFEERCEMNFDHPDAIDSDLLISHMRDLLAGRPIEAPSYDFTCHNRFPTTRRVEPTPVVIVEGLFALAFAELVQLCEIRVFVEAPRQVCLMRRMYRDTHERARTEDEVAHRFNSHVWPMYERYILPDAAKATLQVSGTVERERSLELVLSSVERIFETAA